MEEGVWGTDQKPKYFLCDEKTSQFGAGVRQRHVIRQVSRPVPNARGADWLKPSRRYVFFPRRCWRDRSKTQMSSESVELGPIRHLISYFWFVRGLQKNPLKNVGFSLSWEGFIFQSIYEDITKEGQQIALLLFECVWIVKIYSAATNFS